MVTHYRAYNGVHHNFREFKGAICRGEQRKRELENSILREELESGRKDSEGSWERGWRGESRETKQCWRGGVGAWDHICKWGGVERRRRETDKVYA
eukprot:1373736-Amorphochlora_amoeboformis.AAC.1